MLSVFYDSNFVVLAIRALKRAPVVVRLVVGENANNEHRRAALRTGRLVNILWGFRLPRQSRRTKRSHLFSDSALRAQIIFHGLRRFNGPLSSSDFQWFDLAIGKLLARLCTHHVTRSHEL
jgi:hypothetical protein